MTTINLLENERLDNLERDGLMLIQNSKKFCFGVDAVLLSWFARAGKNDRVLDMCTGTGVIPILMSSKTQAKHLTGMEIQADIEDMACRSIEYNGLSDRISMVCADIKQASSIFGNASFEVVTVNPPYMAGNEGLKGSDYSKTVSRHEVLCTLDDVVREASKVLVPGGRLYMVHRPYRLTDIIVLMKQYKLSPRRICMVYPKLSKEAKLILIEGVKGGNTQVKMEPPVILFEENGEETMMIKQIHGRA